MFEDNLTFGEYTDHLKQTYIDIAMELVALQDNAWNEALALVDELPASEFQRKRIRAEIIHLREDTYSE